MEERERKESLKEEDGRREGNMREGKRMIEMGKMMERREGKENGRR